MTDSSELLEAEKALISGCIQDKEIYDKASSSLTIDDFSNDNIKLIYNDISELMTNTGKVGLASLLDYMKQKKTFTKIKGGKKFLEDITLTYQPVIDEIRGYINVIKDASVARNFFSTIHKIENDYNNNSITDVSEFIAEAEKSIIAVTSKRRISDFRNTDEVITALDKKFLRDYQFRKDNNITESYLTGYPTGYENIDRMTGGLSEGELVILAARPSVGKTALALNIAHKTAKAGRAVGIFSLEMQAEQILLRILQMESKLTSKEINDLSVAKEEYYATNDEVSKRESYNQAIATLKDEPLFIDDNSGLTVNDIFSKTRKLKSQHPELTLVVIDYLGLIASPKSSSNQINRVKEIGDITKGLKAMAKDLNICVLLLCQLSRSVESRIGHEPQLSDLRDSGDIEADTDKAFFIYRPDYYNDDNKNQKGKFSQPAPSQEEQPKINVNPNISPTQLLLLKNRNGATGRLYFHFYKQYCRFEAVANEKDLPEEPK
jgi:replicative DNA helicase